MIVIKQLSDIRMRVGQLLLMGFDGAEMSGRLRSTLASLQPGGIILFARNIQSPRQTYDLVHECQKALAVLAFRCVDLEGGTVDRMRNVIAPAPAAADVFASGDRGLYRSHGRILGEETRTLGFNVDFAPVFDLAFAPSRPVLTTRPVSADPKKTVVYCREFLRGLKSAGVLGCGKHFPGLGEANLDTHQELPQIAKPWKRLWNEDLYPYRVLRREIAFVMAAHAGYPDVTRDSIPATLSKKWLSEILRKKVGYHGLIMADDLEMGGVLAAASIEDAAIGTLEAGSDIFPVCHNEDKVWQAYEAVLSRAERDRKFARLVAERARRVMQFKRRSREMKRSAPPPTDKAIDILRRRLEKLSEQVRAAAVAM